MNAGKGYRVLVVGGGGFYGRYVVRDLLDTTSASIVVASRSASIAPDRRVTVARVDLTDVDGLRATARGADVLVHCAGPFTRLPVSPLDVAIDLGIGYVDIAEDRAFARAARSRHGQAVTAGVPLLTGMSVSPAMEALAVWLLEEGVGSMSALRTYAAPDTRRHRGPAMFETMLFGAGKPFEEPAANRGRPAFGWTEPEWFDLPPPVGRRLTYRIHDMANADVLPPMFGLDEIAFKAGSEWPILNRLVGVAASVRRRTGHPDWSRFARPARALSWLMGLRGREEGGVAFELVGSHATASLALTTDHDGGRIPSLLASVATSDLLTGRYSLAGIADLGRWIDPDRWIRAMLDRDLAVWHRSNRSTVWRRLDASSFPRGSP